MLRGHKILVVGAGGLLGSKLVQAIVREGGNVVAADIDVSAMKQRVSLSDVVFSEDRVTYVNCNINSLDDVEALFQQSDGITGAVNATYPRNKTYGSHFFDVTLSSFNENVGLHLGSAFLFTQRCAAFFERHKTPFSLVNISSIYGVIAPKFVVYDGTPMTMPVEYAAIKSAIIHLSKYAAAYVNDSRFRVNCVSPGGILDRQPDSFLGSYKQFTHGCGMLNVGDVVGSILFLLSSHSAYVTGQNIIVDDGFSL